MRLPNAYKGVKKIFIAEILNLIAIVLIALTLVSVGGMSANVGGGDSSVGLLSGFIFGAAIGAVASFILPIVALIMNLVGLRQASKDERRYFRGAFIAAVVSLVLSIVAGFMNSAETVGSFIRLAGDIAELVTLILSICGIMELAGRLNRQDISGLGNKLLWMLAIAYIVAVVLPFLPFAGVQLALAVASSVLIAIVYIVYVVYLAKAKNMLEEG